MKGCFIRMVLLPLVIISLYPILLLRQPFPTILFPAEGAEATAVISGLFIWFALISYLDIRRYVSNWKQLNQGINRDGERTIVSGIIESKAPSLKAPFSGKECVGYYYKVTHSLTGPSMSTCMDYEGYALIPAIIKCPMGNMKIFAESDKELFYEVPLINQNSEISRVRSYLEACAFEEVIEGPGHFRTDKKIGDPPDLEVCKMEEAIIQPGDLVLAEGIYSSQYGGIKPDPDSIMKPFHLVPGGEVSLKRKIKNRTITIAICLGLSAVTFTIYYLMFGQKILF